MDIYIAIFMKDGTMPLIANSLNTWFGKHWMISRDSVQSSLNKHCNTSAPRDWPTDLRQILGDILVLFCNCPTLPHWINPTKNATCICSRVVSHIRRSVWCGCIFVWVCYSYVSICASLNACIYTLQCRTYINIIDIQYS